MLPTRPSCPSVDRAEIIAATRAELAKHADELTAAYVFGSTARGTLRKNSDLDLGLLCRAEPLLSLQGMGFDLAHELELVLRRPVDVVVLNRAAPDLVHRILRDGLIVLDADRPARLAFEVYARSQYLDLAPLLRQLRATPARATGQTSSSQERISEIETYVSELRSLARPDLIASDLRERRFAEHTLQLAIQACLDISSHIASDDGLGEVESYGELFTLLALRGYIPSELAARLRRMAGFRNLLVHNYTRVLPEIVARAVTQDVGDLLEFTAALRASLALP